MICRVSYSTMPTPSNSKDRYQTCLDTMYQLRRFGIILGLETIENILKKLGDPHTQFKSIHIAGTNGKGSVASALANILYRAGYKVGLYTSPHLVRFNERIQINNQPISNDRVVETYETVNAVHQGDREPTFFEFNTAMAFLEFSHQQVDWAIIETGMGGRLDATNVVTPELSIITNISLEHQMYLGNTIGQIASEKAGIIKHGKPVITGVRQKSAIAAVETAADDKKSPVYRMGQGFRIRRHPSGSFTYYGLDHTWPKVTPGLFGKHQADNAALALAACEVLNRNGCIISLDHIQEGLLTQKWPGRLEVINPSPMLLLDGAHNMNAVRELAGFLKSNLKNRKISLVSGILDDKAYPAMLKCLLPLCQRAILTQPKIDRSLAPDTLLEVAKEIISDVTAIASVPDAVNHAMDTSKPEDVVCVAGSLYLVGEVKESIENGLIPI